MSDPEHPITLGSLAVRIVARYLHQTPRSQPAELEPSDCDSFGHSPQSTLQSGTVIGLEFGCRLEESLPPDSEVDVRIKDGTQFNSGRGSTSSLRQRKEWAAALWNPTLQSFNQKMLETCE